MLSCVGRILLIVPLLIHIFQLFNTFPTVTLKSPIILHFLYYWLFAIYHHLLSRVFHLLLPVDIYTWISVVGPVLFVALLSLSHHLWPLLFWHFFHFICLLLTLLRRFHFFFLSPEYYSIVATPKIYISFPPKLS